MTFTSSLRTALSFRVRQVTALALLFYVAVSVVLFLTDRLAPTSNAEKQDALGLNLEEAYEDLYVITARPHPFNSRQNDRVRTYLLSRLNDVAEGHSHVHVLNDNTTAAFQDGSVVTYFQGNNILVRVDGSQVMGDGSGVLFSVHFDSVSTAPGATDDGMNIASLLQMVAYLAQNRPRRTAIFNFNNGEEDGLHGAHSFLAHPWSNLTSTFLNFEGAGAGGRPFLFRANSLPILRAFTHAHVPHLLANAISADAFAMRVIRSETDYAVYAGPRTSPSLLGGQFGVADHSGYTGTGGGMRGADVAFYQHRARYHTPEDSIRAMGRQGTRKALWASMETVRGAGAALLSMSARSLGEDVVEDAEPATYFSLFGTFLIAFPLRTLFFANIILLVLGPIILLSFSFLLYRQSLLLDSGWVRSTRGYGRFWFALLVSIGLHIGLVAGYLKLNPYTAHAHSAAVLASILTLSYIGFTLVLSIAQYVRPVPPAKQKFAILIEVYFVTWVFLVGATIFVGTKNLSGLYWVGAWNATALLAATLGMIEGLVGHGHSGREIILPCPPEDADGGQSHEEQEEAATERTPLINSHRTTQLPPSSVSILLDESVQDRSSLWWMAQMLFSVPVPLYFLGTLLQLWIQSMAQTAPDGGWTGILFIPLSLASILILLPLAPYAHKMHYLLTTLVVLVFVASTTYSWLVWPFNTSDSRLKVWFTSYVELTNLTQAPTANVLAAPQLVRATTELSAVSGFVDRVVVELPSSQAANASLACADKGRRPGLATCSWTVSSRWHPSVSRNGTWIQARAVRVNVTTARFNVRGENTRACRVSVANRTLRRFRVRSDTEHKWTEYTLPGTEDALPVRELRLWSRTWDDAFEAEIVFTEDNGGPIEGHVSCDWAEYAGGWTGGIASRPPVNGRTGAWIPALEEVLAFLPEWAVVTKIDDGLVLAESGFLLE
ncbi:hypothetical protein K488DRAFT_44533 [Vararia minispora EC-137]|uniref:Uncharacterized protein n=1 Tax=Vararia minispora EC-137 TaxID=1314806 RepID=A0ACB8QSV4_9AGAM|nr:hypothetical protein K488DRAFT_44533 [Vararia minispora EC-137]